MKKHTTQSMFAIHKVSRKSNKWYRISSSCFNLRVTLRSTQ